jgi:ornithine cyclodeaminase/alanine dehydrogenase-like protein (mu-crystallin family)
MRIRVLTSQEIEDVISMADAIDVIAEAYSAFSAGMANVPQRISLPSPGGVSLIMPAYLEPSGALAVKLVSVFRHNLQRDLPTVHALVCVIDSVTGRPSALMEGTYLTALRTGAGSGVATRLLARQDAHVFALCRNIDSPHQKARPEHQGMGAVRSG